jgi:hypothetical protein
MSLTPIELSHAELRVAVDFAMREIRKLNFGKKQTRLERMLTRTLEESRVVAQANDRRLSVKSPNKSGVLRSYR